MRLSILDAARDYMRIGMARIVSHQFANLFIGEKGERLDHVAPHMFTCDGGGTLEHMTLSGERPDEVGIVAESDTDFPTVFKHFRRLLTVVRERDHKRVLFRFYDPRVLRAFLPVCTTQELSQFFGPVQTFRCQGDDPGAVLSFSREKSGRLRVDETAFDDYFFSKFGVRPSEVQPLPSPSAPPPESETVRHIRRLMLRNARR